MSKQNKIVSLPVAVEMGFDHESITREALETYASVLGVTFNKRTSDETIRNRLREKMGMEAVEVVTDEDGGRQAPEVVKHDALPAREGSESLDFINSLSITPDIEVNNSGLTVQELWALNLTPHGAWQGRRRMIQIERPPGTPQSSRHPYYFAWSGMECYVPYGSKYPLMWPIYQIIKDTLHKVASTRVRQNEDGFAFAEHVWTPAKGVPYSDDGDDPATAHLPRNQQEQFAEIFYKLDMLKGVKMSALMAMAKRLRVSTIDNVRDQRTVDRDELADRLLQKVGLPINLRVAA